MNNVFIENDFKGNREGAFTAIFSGMDLYLGEWGECYRFTFINESRTFIEYSSQSTPSKRNKFGRFLKYLSGQEFNKNISPNPSHYIGEKYFLLCEKNKVGTVAITCFAPIPERVKIKKHVGTCPFAKDVDIEKLKSEMLCDNGLSNEEDAALSDQWEEKQKRLRTNK